MSGKVYDRQQLTVDRSPTKTLAAELGHLKVPNPIDMLGYWVNSVRDFAIEAIRVVTGIDLSGWTAFMAALPGFDAGKIISGILAGIHIPLMDASKIVTGVFNAVMIPFLDAGKIISGIFGGARIPPLDASKIVSGQFAQEMVAGLQTGMANLGAGIQNAVAGVQGAINGIVNGLLGLTGDWWSQAQADAALKAQAAATAAIAAAVAQLEGESNQDNTGGIHQSVDFTVLPNTLHLPPSFVETYLGGQKGTFGVVNGAAAVTTDEEYYVRRDVIGELTAGKTVSDYQRIGGVWNGMPGMSYQNPSPFFTPAPYFNPYGAEHVIYCRYKDALNWTRVRFTADGVNFPPFAILETCVAGQLTELTRESHAFKANTAYWIEAGTGGGLRIFRVMCGTTPVIVFPDSANVTQVGELFRGGSIGAGFWGPGGAGWAANPAGLVYFTVQDNPPFNAYLGKQARWYRASTSGPGAPNAGTMVPNGFFDTVDYNNASQVFVLNNTNTAASNNCRLTVTEKGLYQITARFNLSGPGAVIGYLWKKGILHKRGGSGTYESQSVWNVNLEANDYVNVGVAAPNGYNYMGDNLGAFTYLEIRQLIAGK